MDTTTRPVTPQSVTPQSVAPQSVAPRSVGPQSVDPVSPWLRIAAAVARYPSPHNTQPLHLHVDGHDATVLFDTACALPAHPLGVLFGHVTLGVYVESASIVAHSLGHELDVTLLGGPVVASTPPSPLTAPAADSARLQVLARLRLRPAADGAAPDLDPDLLDRRRTSRLPYDGRDVPAEVLADLAAECTAAGHRFGSTAQPDRVAAVVDLNQRTLFDDLSIPAVRDELRRWVRFSRAAAERSGDGFSPQCLHTPGPLLRSVLTRPRLWALPPLRALSRRVYLQSMRGTPRVAWVRGPVRDVHDAVAAGRLLIRLWLRLAAHGVAVHPFGSVVTNGRSLAGFDELAGPDQDVADASTWMILRLGYSDPPPPSRRRPLHAQVHVAALADEGVR